MHVTLSAREWAWIAAGFYLAVFLWGTWEQVRGRRHSTALTLVLMALGYLCQFRALYMLGTAAGGCPLGNPFEILQFTAWSATTLYLMIGVAFRSSMLGYFTACLAAVLSILSLAFPGWAATRTAGVFGNNPWIEFHAALALFSYGVFGLLALTSLMFLLRHHSLKSKHVGGWFSFLPSILDLDLIGVRLLGAGVVLLTASLAVGAVWWLRDTASAPTLKLSVTIAVWAASALVLILRMGRRLLAKRFAWTCLALFAAAMISLAALERGGRTPAQKVAAADRP